MSAALAADIAMTLDALCREAGACRWGVAEAGPVAEADVALYGAWLERGAHGPMAYMERYPDVRRDPRLLLEGARSILVCAFSYRQRRHSAHISDYALGSDYHGALRVRLEELARKLRGSVGGDTRVCVDSAPLRERYWAVRAGVGTVGLSGRLIVPGAGADVVLGEVLCTAALPPSAPLGKELCDGCRRCVNACPAGALDGRGGVDGRLCLSCLTIEHRGELPAGTRLHGRLAGCDVCGAVCPASRREADSGGAETIDELRARPDVLALTPAEAAVMTRGRFKAMFGGSAIMRLRVDGLRRNARIVLGEE